MEIPWLAINLTISSDTSANNPIVNTSNCLIYSINEKYIEASLRFDSWKTNLQKLENIKNLNYEKYIQETKLEMKLFHI